MTTVESLPAVLAAVDGKLTRNALRCLDCDTIIESKYRHGYRTCGCPNRAMVDGGLAYRRWGATNPEHIENMSEYGPPRSWEGIDLTCPTCEGETLIGDEGLWAVYAGTPNHHYRGCERCVGGHPIIDVWACGADPTIRVEPPPVKCEQCFPVRVSIQAVPIVGHWARMDDPSRPYIRVWDDEAPTVYASATGPRQHITLPAGARPGQWAIVATKKEETA